MRRKSERPRRALPRSGRPLWSRSSPEEREQSGLRISLRADWQVVAEHAGAPELRGQFLRNREAGLDQIRIKRGVLAGGPGDVPTVDQAVHKQLRRVVRPRIIAK